MKKLAQLLEKDLTDMRVLVRCDFNIPIKNGTVLDKTRIRQHKKTIDALVQAGAKVVLLSHFGTPGGKHVKELSLNQLLPVLKAELKHDIDFMPDCIGEAASWAIEYSKKQVLLAENTRFHPGERLNAPDYVAEMASLGASFVNDAFSITHRPHASVLGLAQTLPSFAGFALAQEVENIEKYLAAPKSPALAIIGGSKIASKALVLERLLPQMDSVAVGGAMANAFLVALGKMTPAVGKVGEESIAIAKSVLATAEKQNTTLLLPVDMVCAKSLRENAAVKICPIDDVPTDWGCFDIGPQSVAAIEQEIEKAQTILWNGPLGAFEIKPFDRASLAIAQKVAAGNHLSVAGGGETLAVIHLANAADGWTHISTAGGAFLAWLEGKPLPALEALD